MSLEQMKNAVEEQPIAVQKILIDSQNSNLTPEVLATMQALLKAIQMKQQGNGVVTFIDSFGMTKLEAFFYEAGHKSNIVHHYKSAGEF